MCNYCCKIHIIVSSPEGQPERNTHTHTYTYTHLDNVYNVHMPKFSCYMIYVFTFTFTHLADAFIQSDLHCIQVTVSTFLSALAFPGNRTHDLGVASAMLYQLSYRKVF